MKKILQLLPCVLLITGFTACNNSTNKSAGATKDPIALYNQIDQSKPSNTITEKEKAEGWQLLFDGRTANGWHGYNQKGIPDTWTVEDGTLTMNSVGANEEQDIITDKVYKSFALTVEYKITPVANSGILFHIKEDPKYTFAYETGPEYQIIDHENWENDILEDTQTHGANYSMYAPMKKAWKPVGEWNRMMLVVDGNNVTQILNGEVVVKYTKYSDEWNALRHSGKWAHFPDWGNFDEGHISLQNHGTKVWFRNILLKEL